MQMSLYSYIVLKDYGFAPNPYWGKMTLTTCKPDIRIHAAIGDWIIGTGSANVHRQGKTYVDYSCKLVFAMKVGKVLTLKEYDAHCLTATNDMRNKIPRADTHWKLQNGDCIYRYPIRGNRPIQRPGLHCDADIEKDLRGLHSLISDEFYYFGENAICIPDEFESIIKKGQGYIKCGDTKLIEEFTNWLRRLYPKRNILEGDPQLRDTIDEKFKNPN